jgi:hypothetical protein
MKSLFIITLLSLLLTVSSCKNDSPPELIMAKWFDLIIRNQDGENLIGTTYNLDEVFVIDNYGYEVGVIYYDENLGYVISGIRYSLRFSGEYNVLLNSGDTDTLRFEYIDVPGSINFYYNKNYITNVSWADWRSGIGLHNPKIIVVK